MVQTQGISYWLYTPVGILFHADQVYTWIRHPVWTHKKSIFRKTKRAKQIQSYVRTKSSRRDAYTGVG